MPASVGDRQGTVAAAATEAAAEEGEEGLNNVLPYNFS